MMTKATSPTSVLIESLISRQYFFPGSCGMQKRCFDKIHVRQGLAQQLGSLVLDVEIVQLKTEVHIMGLSSGSIQLNSSNSMMSHTCARRPKIDTT